VKVSSSCTITYHLDESKRNEYATPVIVDTVVLPLLSLLVASNMKYIFTSDGRDYDVSDTSDAIDFLQAVSTATGDGEQVMAVNAHVCIGRQLHNANVVRDLMTHLGPVLQKTKLPAAVHETTLSNFIQQCVNHTISFCI
jgi:hypothetical protein